VPQSNGHDISVSSASHSAFPQQFCAGGAKMQPTKGSQVSFDVQALLSSQVLFTLAQRPVEGLQESEVV